MQIPSGTSDPVCTSGPLTNDPRYIANNERHTGLPCKVKQQENYRTFRRSLKLSLYLSRKLQPSCAWVLALNATRSECSVVWNVKELYRIFYFSFFFFSFFFFLSLSLSFFFNERTRVKKRGIILCSGGEIGGKGD